MKVFLIISGIMILLGGLAVGFLGYPGVMTIAFFGFIGLLVVANLDRISEIKASSSGIEAKTREVREVIARAESTLSELQLLARNVAEVTLSLVKRNGRMGGYDDDEADRIKSSVLAVLKKVGIPEADFPDILREWNKFTEFDYAGFILGHNLPDTKDHAIVEEWKNLRHGGINQIPTPATLRSFLTKHNFMTEALDEYLKDYEHFLAYKVHRRPDVWAQRATHRGRLKTS